MPRCATSERQTAQRKARPGAESTEERLNSLLENIGEAFLALDREGRVTYANRQAERLSGLKRDQMLTRCIWDLLPEAVGTVFEQQYRRAVAEQIAVTFAAPYPPLGLWVEVRAYPSPAGMSVFITDITERRRTEEALRRDEERYRTLFASMGEGYAVAEMVFDRDLRPVDYIILEVNQAYERQSGLRSDQVVGRRVTEFLHTVEPVWFERFGGVVRAGKPVRFEEYNAALDRWYSVYAFPLPAKNQLGIIFSDITARKRAEAERERLLAQVQAANQQLLASSLREQETAEEARRRTAELDAVIENTDAMLALFDPSFRFLLVNSAYARSSGHTKSELIGRSHFALFPDPENEAIFQRVRDTGVPYRAIEKPFEYADQPWRGVTYWNWILVPIQGPTGHIWGLLLSLLDVTPQVRARHQTDALAREVQQRAAELEATLGAISSGLVILGPHDELVRLNAAAERLLGITTQDWRRPSARGSQVIHPETPDGRPLPLEKDPRYRALRGETVLDEHLVIRRPDGSRRHVLTSTAPLRDREARIIGAVANWADITPLVELQEHREDLLRAVSHDLRNPLTGIQGHAQMLERRVQRGAPPGKLRENVDSIIAGTRRMNTMIQDLVDSARLESGQLVLQLTAVDLGAYLPGLMQRLTGTMDLERIRVDLPPDLPPVLADVDRLDRILTNLLSNAMKYSAPATPVEISAVQGEGEVITSVTDHGPGIPPEQLPRLFQRYARAQVSRGDREGLGLGLYITRQLVQAHGGRIWVESQVGVGSTFSFSLPVAGAGDRGGEWGRPSRQGRPSPAADAQNGPGGCTRWSRSSTGGRAASAIACSAAPPCRPRPADRLYTVAFRRLSHLSCPFASFALHPLTLDSFDSTASAR